MTMKTSAPARHSIRRKTGKIDIQPHNKDRLGSQSGPMGPEDQRKDKYGSRHNQDPLGLPSAETEMNREELGGARQYQASHRRHRNGSRK